MDEQKTEVEKKEELLQTLQTGISSNAGSDGGYAGQLSAARDGASKAGTEIEQSKLKITHLESRIKEDEPRAKKAEKENTGLMSDLETLRKQAGKLEKELEKLGFEPGREEQQQAERSAIEKRIRSLQADAEQLRRKVAGLDFSYTDPSPNFDRRRVKGLVAQLFNLPADKAEASTALEICAGGRLYNVVVDSADTGTQLLQNGKLRRRVTIVATRLLRRLGLLQMVLWDPLFLVATSTGCGDGSNGRANGGGSGLLGLLLWGRVGQISVVASSTNKAEKDEIGREPVNRFRMGGVSTTNTTHIFKSKKDTGGSTIVTTDSKASTV